MINKKENTDHSKNEHNLDQLFKEKLADYITPDAQPNWELFHYVYSQNQKKQKLKGKIFFFVSGIFTCLVLLLTILFNNNNNTDFFSKISFKPNNQSAQLNEKNNLNSINPNNTNPIQIFNSTTNRNSLSQINALSKKTEQLKFSESTLNTNTFHAIQKNSFVYSSKHSSTFIPVLPQESNIVGNAYTLNPAANTSEKNKDTLAYINVSYLEKIFSVDKDSVKVDIEPLNINTEYSEFAPVMTADGEIFYFTSNRPNEFSKKKNKNLFENIYVSYRQKNGFSPPQLLSTPINVSNRHNSAIGLSNDGQTMFLYRDDEKGTGDIYISRLSGTNWSEPEKLPPPVNSEYHESSASLSPDGKILFFISERPGGKGKKDIWYAVLDKNGKWTSAKPLNDINTPMDEESVFMHPDGKTLYFSSKGYKGLGGYDIYKTTFEKNGKCTPPENLGKDINSPEDDFYYIPEANGKVAYFTSKRNGNADIFKVTITPLKVKKDYSAKLTLFKGKVVDKSTQQPLEAEIEITDLSNNTVVSKAVSNSATGNFLISLPFGVNYGINVKKEGYLFYSENVYVPKTEDYKELIKLIELEKIKVGERIILKNIFFEFDKADLLPESKMELDRLIELLNKYPKMKIEIGGHTDSKGNDEYNLKLSQARAQAVVDYLINKGISKDRLQAKGYGETKPIAPNQNPDGSDNEEGRQLNRRTEFKILEY